MEVVWIPRVLRTLLNFPIQKIKQYLKLTSGLLTIWSWDWKQSTSSQMVKIKVFAHLMLGLWRTLWSSPLSLSTAQNIFPKLKGSIIFIVWSSCGFRLLEEMCWKLDLNGTLLGVNDSLMKYERTKSQWHSLDQLIFLSWKKVKRFNALTNNFLREKKHIFSYLLSDN